MKEKIVTLDDGREFCVINEFSLNDRKYCVALEYFEDIEDIGDKYFAFEEQFDTDHVVFEPVIDNDLEDYLILKTISEEE